MLRDALRSRRSLSLCILGVVYVLVGVSQIVTEDSALRDYALLKAYDAHLRLWPLRVWGALFAAVGVGAVLSGLTRRHTWGFASLMGMSTWWAAMFAMSWLATGYHRVTIHLLTWLIIAAFLGILSGWPDPPPTRRT